MALLVIGHIPPPPHHHPAAAKRIAVYYDNECLLDTQQVDLVAEHPDFTRVPCHGSMHNLLGTWYRQRQLQE
jgi:hypothetical protein